MLVEELGLEPSEQLRELEQAILRQEVPPPRPPQLRHNLPSPATSFVGRAAELADVETLLAEGRLVTLTGVGGVGKTRLALETASRLLPDFADGVFWCDLSALTEPALVPRAVARLVDVREPATTSLLENLAARLREAEVLLLLDNCEHLRHACAELAQALLPACPRLRLLATSREPLGADGETDYPVPPLSGEDAAGEPGESLASDAVSLFLARARAARPQPRRRRAALAAAGRICAELDGLPLAIELAAARAKALSFPEIEARLVDRFRFLVSWRRLTPARHQTLREAMDWSYELLTPEEQSLLAAARGLQRRLHARGRGRGLSRRRRACARSNWSAAWSTPRLSFPRQHDGVTRYRLLETVRQYARERIGEQNERAGTERRLAQYVLGLVERTRVGPAVGVAGVGGSARAGARESAHRAHLEPGRRRARVAAPAGERRVALLVGERRPRRRQHVARDGARAGSRERSGAPRRRRSRGPPGSPGQREISNARANTRSRRCRSSPPPGIIAASRRR